MSAGVLNQLSFKKESTWGTAVVPDKSIPVKFSGGINTKNNIQLVSNMRAILAKNCCAVVGKRSHEGEITFDAFADYTGYFALGALGSVSSTVKGGETVVYNHTFSEAATKPSLTIEEMFGEDTRRYAGSLIEQLKISGKSGETVQIAATVKAKSQASATAITAAYTTVPAFTHSQIQVKIGGSAIAEVENFELTYKNGLEMVYALGSADPAYYSVTGSEVSGKFDIYLDSTSAAQVTNYLNKTQQSVEIIATNPDTTIGTSSNYTLDILMPQTVLTVADRKLTANHNVLSVEFAGMYDTTTSKLMSVVLTNLLTNYTS
jgi:hypothetical protein